MSVFSDIIVVQKPTEFNNDWSLVFEGIKIDIHDAKVELDESIMTFEKFQRSMNAFDALLDHIENNNDRVDKAVFEFVNQNDELAHALGIILPYDFATEDDQTAAANDIKNSAAVNNSNDGDGNKTESPTEEKGFFAAAWDKIKKFFKMIKDAIVNLWNKLTGESTESARQAAKEVSNASMNENPEITKSISNMLGVDLSNVSASKRYLTIDDFNTVIAAAEKIASETSLIKASPTEFITWKGKAENIGGVLGQIKIEQELKTLGLRVDEPEQNGIKKKIVTYVREGMPGSPIGKEKLQKVIDCYKKPENRAQLSTISDRFFKVEESLKLTISNLTTQSEQILSNPQKLEEVAKSMVSNVEWTKKPHIEAKKSFWRRAFGLDASREERQRAAEQNKRIDARNNAVEKGAIERETNKKRAEIQVAMAYEQELADYCRSILQLINLFHNDVTATIFYLNKVVKKCNGERHKEIEAKKESKKLYYDDPSRANENPAVLQ